MPGEAVSDNDVDDRDAADELCQQLVRTFRTMKRNMVRTAQQRSDDMDFPSYALLTYVLQEGPLRATALAELAYVDLSTVSRQTAVLVQRGLLERQADPIDGRAFLLAVTEEGRAAFEACQRRHSEIVARAVRDWPASRIYELATLLDQFTKAFEHSTLPSARSNPLDTEDQWTPPPQWEGTAK